MGELVNSVLQRFSRQTENERLFFINRIVVVPWNGWDILKAVALIIGLFFAVYFSYEFFSVFVLLVLSEDTGAIYDLYTNLMIDHGVIFGVMLLCVWMFSLNKYAVSWRTLGFCRPSASHLFLLVPLIFAIDWGFETVYHYVVSLFGPEALIPEQEYIEELFEEAPFKPLLYFDIVIITPIVEEILFRGFILAWLTLALGNLKGMVIASALFALVHLDLDLMPPFFVSGMLIAWLYMRTGSLWPPIAMHALTNAVATVQYEFFN